MVGCTSGDARCVSFSAKGRVGDQTVVSCDWSCDHAGYKAMDHNGVSGGRLGAGHAETWTPGGDIHSHHIERGDEGVGLSSLSE